MLFRIKSSPLQSAPIRFSASLFSAKQGGSNPLLLVSGRFRLCSALPSQFGWFHFQASPWLLFAFRAVPFRIRSDPCASAGLGSKSARFGSCPSLAIASPCQSGRIDSPQRHCASSPVSAELIRCQSTQVKSGLITSVANRGCARQSPVSSAPPAPISAVPVRFHPAQCGTSPFHLYSSSILSRRCRAIAPRLCASRISAAHRRFGSQAFDARPFRFTSWLLRAAHFLGNAIHISAVSLPRLTIRYTAAQRRLHALLVRSIPCRNDAAHIRNQALFAAFFSASFLAFFAFIAAAAFRPSSVWLPPMMLPSSSSSSHSKMPLPELRHWARPRRRP